MLKAGGVLATNLHLIHIPSPGLSVHEKLSTPDITGEDNSANTHVTFMWKQLV